MINGFRSNNEVKMKNKRGLIISVISVLVVILGLASFLAYSRLTENAQPIPVTGGSNNSSGANQFESAEQIQAQEGLQALNGQQALAPNRSVTNQFESAEQIQAQQGLQSIKDRQSQSSQ
jgi:hypothetical protein